jgi:hypothetical protein
MNTYYCCQSETQGHDRRPASRWRHRGEIAGWIIPSATLALLPKCPACVVAYVALATGLGISISTAAHLRTLLGLSCLILLAFVAAKRLRRHRAGARASRS